MTTKEHPHAEVLRAIADGVPVEEFEVGHEANDGWCNMKQHQMRDWLLADPTEWKIRRKPQYIMVNGFKVPKPLAFIPAEGVFVPTFHDDELCEHWKSFNPKETSVNRGVAHSTKEAAIAHAKAILGIDPEYFK